MATVASASTAAAAAVAFVAATAAANYLHQPNLEKWRVFHDIVVLVVVALLARWPESRVGVGVSWSWGKLQLQLHLQTAVAVVAVGPRVGNCEKQWRVEF